MNAQRAIWLIRHECAAIRPLTRCAAATSLMVWKDRADATSIRVGLAVGSLDALDGSGNEG
jgi:hypothetical protein